MWCNNEYANLRFKEQTRLEVCDTFYCTIEPLNLSDFMMNLIEEFDRIGYGIVNMVVSYPHTFSFENHNS